MSAHPLFDLDDIVLKEYFFLHLAVLNHAPRLLTSPVDLHNAHLEREMVTGIGIEESIVEVQLRFTVVPRDTDNRPLPVEGQFHLLFHFAVLGLAEAAKMHTGPEPFQPDRDLVHTVASLAYSTARGLLLERTRDTVLSGFSLPAIDVRTLPWNTGSPPADGFPAG